MERYDYRKEMVKDIRQYISDNDLELKARAEEMDRDRFAEWLNDELWPEDDITGNGMYGYDDEYKCEEYVGTNLSLYFEAAREFCDFPTSNTPWVDNNPATHMDCTIRCYLLGECIWQALEEMGY